MKIDGIDYELVPGKTGLTTQAFQVMVDGKAADKALAVICHAGAATKWCILAPGGKRVEVRTKPEVFRALSILLHG